MAKKKKKKRANVDHLIVQLNTTGHSHKSIKDYDRKKDKLKLKKELTNY